MSLYDIQNDLSFKLILSAGTLYILQLQFTDTLAGAFVKAILDGYETPMALKAGMEAALKSVNCVDRAISPDL